MSTSRLGGSVTDRLSRVRALVAARLDEAVALRRRLHRFPELGWRETGTTETLAEYLGDRGLDPRVRPGSTGLVVDVGPGGGATVAFRADLDALPIGGSANHAPRGHHRVGGYLGQCDLLLLLPCAAHQEKRHANQRLPHSEH